MRDPAGRAAMNRLVPAGLVAALLVATSLAFVVTEKLKLTRNPIVAPVVDKVFSPVCDCAKAAATITFGLRQADRVDVQIVDEDDEVVRELARSRAHGRGPASYQWDGRDDRGQVVDEGTYRPRVHLDRQRRTIVMYTRIRVDTTPPRIESFSARPLVISPDGDGRFDRAKIRYRADERATVELFVDGVRALRRSGTRPAGTMDWFGNARGEELAEGLHTLRLVARDPAGNLGPQSGSRTVRIRYLTLGRERIVTVPNGRFAVLTLSHARTLRWRLGNRTGRQAPGTLRLRAPAQPGRYVLEVTANGRAKRAIVVVRRPAAT